MSTFKIYGTTFHVDRKYSPIRALGRGAYGVVCSAKDTSTGKKVAIKKITPMAANEVIAKQALREVRLLRHLGRHSNVVSLRDLEVRERDDELYLIMELMDTDLHRIIQSQQSLTDAHHKHFMYQLIRGLRFAHRQGVIHRDLKPSNLLVTKNCDLRITDWGLSRLAPEDQDALMTEHVVTRWYRPPELMLCADGNYDASVDIWSVGCIFAELLGRKPLFPGKNFMHQLCLIFEVIGTPAKKELAFVKSEQAMQFMRSLNTIKKVAFKHIFPGANPKAIDLLENMLVFDPAKRISVDDALNHPYFASVASQYTDPEPEMPPEFEFDFENAKLSKADLRRLIVDEVKSFRAEVRARSRARKGKSKGATSSSSSSLASAASSTASATSNNGRSRSGSRSRDPSGAGGGAGASVRSSSRGKVRSSGYGQKSSTSNNNTAATGSSARGRSSWRDSAAQRRADRSRSNPRRAHAAASAGSRGRGTTRRQSDSQATGAAAAAASAGARAGGSGSGSSSGGSHTARGPRPEEDQKKGAIYRTSSGTRMISGKGTAGRTAVAAAAPVAPAPADDGVDADRGSASSGDDDDEIVTRRTSAPAQRPPAVPAQQPKPHRRNPSAAWTETSEDTPVEARDVSSASASPSGGPATRSPASTEPGVTSPATTPPAAAAASSSPAPAPSAWAHAAVAPGSPPRPSRTAGLSKPMVTPPPTGPTSRRLANGAATPGSLVAQSPLPVSPVNTSEAKQAPPPSPAVAKAAAAATRTARQFAPSSGSRHHVSPPSTSATSATAPGDHIASPAWSPPPARNARGGYYGSRHQQPRLPPSQRSPQRVARSSGAGATTSHDSLRDRVAQASAAASAVLAQPPGRSYMSGVTVPRPFSFATSSRSRSSRSIASTGSADDDAAARAARDRARQRARARPHGSDRDAVGQTVYDAHVSAAAAAGSSGGASGSRGGGGSGYAEETTGTRDVRMLLRAAGGSHRDVGGSAGAGSAAGSSRGPTVVKPFRFATEDRNRSRSRGHGSTRYGVSSGTNGGEGMPATHATAHGVMGRAVSYRRTTSTSSMTSGASGASAEHHGAGGGGGDDDDAGVGGSARPRRKVTVPRSPNFSKMSWERRTGARGGGSSRSGRHRHPRAHSAARTRKTQVY